VPSLSSSVADIALRSSPPFTRHPSSSSALATHYRVISASSISVKASCGSSTSTVYQVTSWSSWATASSTCSSARTVQVGGILLGFAGRFGADLLSPLSSLTSLSSSCISVLTPPRLSSASPPHTSSPSAELNNTLATLTDAETQDPSVSHALAVRLAVTQGNYTKLFRLFMAAPKMGAYIMDHFVERERIAALVTMTKA